MLDTATPLNFISDSLALSWASFSSPTVLSGVGGLFAGAIILVGATDAVSSLVVLVSELVT